MTLGLYIPKNSPIHALSPSIKLAGMAIAGISIFFISNIPWLVATLGVILLLVKVAQLSWRLFATQLRPSLWIFAGIFLLHAILNDWRVGLIIVLRFAILLLLATLITLTTKVSHMVDALERGLTPLRPLGVRPAQISLMMAIAIRLIPVLLNQIHEVQDAQRARGIDTPIITLFVPVLIRVLQLADHLAEALDARGYGDD
ncbi:MULTISPECIES: energy-coupling factor transporter transmembrane protein EcfT [unclassified Leptolyngbya]|uniref:energy-coupling factor transporter transmembrane component T family protein n=1 Tax=unclassified Leptolyngbya TaxID=2650499 RepID=UPI001684517E|nr:MULTISPECIES: energy-coupling factor transporter transmembrane protein EcfT [unclassified Leptolyngbya]MBD1910805.1 energy-coupling factor transporter transmembrane protein EcfT [Leptolyngbya sp. FACHB-8]MBD2157626.1 energy-coupling factor transporter transmembrane protein EcfT [Leptolyngbya sp. FACHB-16]